MFDLAVLSLKSGVFKVLMKIHISKPFFLLKPFMNDAKIDEKQKKINAKRNKTVTLMNL